jgi:hypothetical protein
VPEKRPLLLRLLVRLVHHNYLLGASPT